MKVLIINKFLYPKGGDAICALAEGRLLGSKGHAVSYWGMSHPSNPEYPHQDLFVAQVDYENPKSIGRFFKTALNILYSFEAKEKIEKVVQLEKPDLVHLHNFAHQISPSILHVFKKYKIPVVMTMHDYKLVCASYALLSENKICELCKGQKYYYCFLEGCVKHSRAKSLVNTVEMYLHHKVMHLYDLIDLFISPSRFLKAKVEEMGLGREVVYVPNFIELDDYKPEFRWHENAIVYFGRLSKEKGLSTLIEAVEGLPNITLKIIGEGPEGESLKSKVKSQKIENVKFLGYKTGDGLKDEIRKSMFVVLPSECYENNPRSVIESFALGKPVIGANIGGIPELVQDGVTGFVFEPGNPRDLRARISALLDDADQISQMGTSARKLVEREFTQEIHYEKLMEVYKQAMDHHSSRSTDQVK